MSVAAFNLVTIGTSRTVLNDRVECGWGKLTSDGVQCPNCFAAEDNYIIVNTLDLPVFSLAQ